MAGGEERTPHAQVGSRPPATAPSSGYPLAVLSHGRSHLGYQSASASSVLFVLPVVQQQCHSTLKRRLLVPRCKLAVELAVEVPEGDGAQAEATCQVGESLCLRGDSGGSGSPCSTSMARANPCTSASVVPGESEQSSTVAGVSRPATTGSQAMSMASLAQPPDRQTSRAAMPCRQASRSCGFLRSPSSPSRCSPGDPSSTRPRLSPASSGTTVSVVRLGVGASPIG